MFVVSTIANNKKIKFNKLIIDLYIHPKENWIKILRTSKIDKLLIKVKIKLIIANLVKVLLIFLIDFVFKKLMRIKILIMKKIKIQKKLMKRYYL